MKSLLFVIVANLLITSTTVAKTNGLSLPVRRALAKQISELVVLSEIHPAIIAPLPAAEITNHFAGYISKFENTLVLHNQHLLKDWLSILHQEEGTSDKLVIFSNRVYDLAEKTAKIYVRSQPNVIHNGKPYRFGLQWGIDGSVAQMSDKERKEELLRFFSGMARATPNRGSRQGDSSVLDLNTRLAEFYKEDAAILQKIEDYVELLKAFPHLNMKIPKKDVDNLLMFADGGNVSYLEVELELSATMAKAIGRDRNLSGLLSNHGLLPEHIKQKLPSINEHFGNQQVVIVSLSNDDQALIAFTPDSGDNHDLVALKKLRELKVHASSRYLVIWQQDKLSADVGYALLEFDSNGMLQIVPEEKFDDSSVSMHSRVAITDIIDTSIYDAQVNRNYSNYQHNLDQYSRGLVRDFFASNMSLVRISATELGTKTDITYAQLQDPRTLYQATGEFLISRDWSWYKFSKTIFPNDSKKAALFTANYKEWLLQEYMESSSTGTLSIADSETFTKIKKALEAESKALSDAKQINAIETFLAELPSLIAKAVIAIQAEDHRRYGSLTTDTEKREIFEKAIHNNLLGHAWSSMIETFLTGSNFSDSPGRTIFNLVSLLEQGGLTDRRLKDSIFTENVFNKLVEGKIVTEKNLNEMRKLLSEEKIRKIVDKLKLDSEQKAILIERIPLLPLHIQIRGFAKKLAKGVSSSRDLRIALHNVEEKSMYKSIATHLLDVGRKEGRREGEKFFKDLRAKIEKINSLEDDARRMYLMAKKSPIVYFAIPMRGHQQTEEGDTPHVKPLLKVGQVAYNKKYIQQEDDGSVSVDLDKLNEHDRLKQVFAAGIDHFLVSAVNLPTVNDHRMRALILDLFEGNGVRKANEELLAGISSGDGITEFLEFTDDIIIEDGMPVISLNKFTENIRSVMEQVAKETATRINEHGYVRIDTAPHEGTTSTSNDTSSSDIQEAHNQDSGFLLVERPVELNPQIRENRRRRNNNNTRGETEQRAPPPQRTEEQLRLEAKAQAKRELSDKINQLSDSIRRGKDLPPDTSIGLHLQALIRYAETTPKELAERADIRNWQERFLSIIKPEASVLPTQEELEAIGQALHKHMNKRTDLARKRQREMAETLQRELESIERKIIAHALEQARPSVSEPKASKPSAKDNATTPEERLLPKGTKKKIVAADVQAFLREELPTTYESFTNLMIELDVITAQALTAKLNETLEAVNAKIDAKKDKVPLLTSPMVTHLIGYEHGGDSNFIDRTLWKLQIIAKYIEHAEKTEIARLIDAIVRAAKVQRFETVEKLNNALKNNKEDAVFTADDFADIQKRIAEAREQWLSDWQSE